MDDNSQQNSKQDKPELPEVFHLMVRNRDGVLFEGEAKWLTSYNNRGKFDILPNHASFISIINKTITIGKADGSSQVIEVNNAVLEFENNSCKIFLGVKKDLQVK